MIFSSFSRETCGSWNNSKGRIQGSGFRIQGAVPIDPSDAACHSERSEESCSALDGVGKRIRPRFLAALGMTVGKLSTVNC